MPDNLFSDLSQILPHLADLDNRVAALRHLARQVESSKIEIFMTLTDGATIALDDQLIPFNLQLEIKTLIEDSIDEFQRQHDNLKKLSDETSI